VKFPRLRFPKFKFPWMQLRSRRKNLVTLILIGIAIVLVFQFALAPLLESQRKIREEIALKKKMLTRYHEYIKSGKEVEDGLSQMVQQVEAIQSKLLSGETPQINAANLQEILKKLSEKNGIQIRSFRIGEPKEMTYYMKISVIIEINPTKSMASLTYFIYDIESYEKLLLISDLDITAPNMRSPAEVQGSLTVTGFTKNTHPQKGKGKEG
jgi:Tfp pilus assembly protein PilO